MSIKLLSRLLDASELCVLCSLSCRYLVTSDKGTSSPVLRSKCFTCIFIGCIVFEQHHAKNSSRIRRGVNLQLIAVRWRERPTCLCEDL